MIEDALKYVRKYSSIDYTYAVENQYPTCIVCIKKKNATNTYTFYDFYSFKHNIVRQ